MKELLRQALAESTADYCEIRLEETEETQISFLAAELENLSESVQYGGNVRALVDGGWGFVTFNTLEDLPEKVRTACRLAKLIGSECREQSRLAPVPIVETEVGLLPGINPRTIPLSEKVRLLSSYNDIILHYDPRISSSRIRYFDRYTVLHFASSEGSYIKQEKLDIGCNLVAVATDGQQIQEGFKGTGSSRDYSVILNLADKACEAARIAVDKLSAPTVKGGTYTVILDPELAGVFAHEAFGHLSEADFVYENPAMQELMKLGTRFGSDILSIYDSGLDEGARGYLRYDDEGVPTEKTYLIKNGILVGRLHSRETAGKMGERPTGNARAINYNFPPIVRMRNTSIEPGTCTFAEMIRDISLGIYAKGAYGGETNGEMFTFAAGEAYMIRDGKLAEMVKNVTLSGNVFSTLKNIDQVGCDFSKHDSAGGCGKGEQFPLPTSEWSPHIRVRNVVIGGEK